MNRIASAILVVAAVVGWNFFDDGRGGSPSLRDNAPAVSPDSEWRSGQQVQGGGKVYFNGEYEWNDKGGVIHWTHRDPQKRHQAGWVEHKGKKHQ